MVELVGNIPRQQLVKQQVQQVVGLLIMVVSVGKQHLLLL
jgi:hypothetical protein